MRKTILFALAIFAGIVTANAGNQVTIDNATCVAGGQVTLSVGMVNEVEVTSWQLEMPPVTGFSVAKDPDDEDYLLVELATSRTTAKKHNAFDSSILTTGNLLVTCASTTNKTYAVGSGDICYITLDIADDVEPGEYTMTIMGAVLTDASDNHSIYPADATCTVTVTAAAGIRNVGQSADTAVYNEAGQKLNTASRGLNIVKTNDGVKKVTKK